MHSLTGSSWVPNDDNELLEISEFRGYEGRKVVCKTDEVQTVLKDTPIPKNGRVYKGQVQEVITCYPCFNSLKCAKSRSFCALYML